MAASILNVCTGGFVPQSLHLFGVQSLLYVLDRMNASVQIFYPKVGCSSALL